MNIEAEADKVQKIIDLVTPLLAGNPPEVQGAVCMHMTATWLAGFRVPRRETIDMLEQHNQHLLRYHAQLVREQILKGER